MKNIFIALMALSLCATSAYADKRHSNTWEVTITNLTPGQTFTPRLFVLTNERINLFTVGEPASDELAALAEGGDTAPLTSLLEEYPGAVQAVQTTAGLLAPGGSETVTLTSHKRKGFLTLAAMLIPTNDTFVALDSLRLPKRGTQIEYALAYDAGSEANDQNCANIPGPVCGGAALSEAQDSDEGFVHVGNGFHLLSETSDDGSVLMPAKYDWNNPVAKITIRALR